VFPVKAKYAGWPMRWIDSERILIWYKKSTYLYSLTDSIARPLCKDSVLVYPFGSKNFIAVGDPSGKRWWISKVRDKKEMDDILFERKEISKKQILVETTAPVQWAWTIDGSYFFIRTETDEIMRISPWDGKKSILKKIPTSSFLDSYEISDDGKAIVYMTWEKRSKLIMIENVFK
jgi:hypothetical protein